MSPNETDLLVKDGYQVIRSSPCRNLGVAVSKSCKLRLNEEMSVARLAGNFKGSALAARLDCQVVNSGTLGLGYFYPIAPQSGRISRHTQSPTTRLIINEGTPRSRSGVECEPGWYRIANRIMLYSLDLTAPLDTLAMTATS